jgi:FtsP/CotA-like multicopper oxidase with cupredoxin domain
MGDPTVACGRRTAEVSERFEVLDRADHARLVAAGAPNQITPGRNALTAQHHHQAGRGDIAATSKLGTVEVWQLVADVHHPVRIHLNPFQIHSRGLSGPGPYDAGWTDTIDLRPSEEATIAIRFDGYRGKYVFHCHNLEHEDMAMMANFTTR